MTENGNYLSRNSEILGVHFEDSGKYCFVWLCGYHSDCSGSKAMQMAQTAVQLGASSLRFDYSGTGISQGSFENGTISKWLGDAIEIIEHYAKNKKLILVGSSMGGWIAILLLRHFENIRGLCLIAPAPDFTQDLMWDRFDQKTQNQMLVDGYWLRPSEYSDSPYKVTLSLIEDGRKNLVLHNEINFEGPVQILHGMNDEDVPFERSINLANKITSKSININFIKDGNHRLSRDIDLEKLDRTLKELFLQVQSEN